MKHSMLMSDGLRRNAANFPQKAAARDRFREITYGELNDRVNRLANGLLSLGIRKGDDVAILVGNRIEHLEILFATAKIGALAIPLDIKWKALELGSVLDFFKTRALILQSDCVPEFEMAKTILSPCFSPRGRRDFLKAALRRTGRLLFTASTTPSRRGSAVTTKRCFPPRSISTPGALSPSASSTLAAR